MAKAKTTKKIVSKKVTKQQVKTSKPKITTRPTLAGLVKEPIKERINANRPIGIVRRYDKKTGEINYYGTKTSIGIIRRKPFKGEDLGNNRF